jgi:flavin-dependent dehydrogenase
VSEDDAEACDVLVIGGGPGGSTAAALLAAQGVDTVLLEKSRHPRFHIGESLLPRNMELFERLGIRPQVEAMGVHKPGAEFISDASGAGVAFRFADSLRQGCSYACHVRRAEFDAALFANARARGARAAEGMRVRTVRLAKGAGRALVQAEGEGGAIRHLAPRFVLDASGRDSFLANALGTRSLDKRNNTAAVFGHFHGVAPSSTQTEGFITIHLCAEGWIWTIPLPDGVTSIGYVGPAAAFKGHTDMQALLLARLHASPTLRPRLRESALASAVSGTGNYSYRARSAWGDGFFLIGDAFGFIDPVFSSGVLMAMTSGERAADVARAWLDDPRAGRAAARRADRKGSREMDQFGWLIHRINDPVLRHMFMSPSNVLRMRDGLVQMLGGHAPASLRAHLPIAAFKLTFRALSLASRMMPGMALHPA